MSSIYFDEPSEGNVMNAEKPSLRVANHLGTAISATSFNVGVGVRGESVSGNGVDGVTTSGNGVTGVSERGRGVIGRSGSSNGVQGISSKETGVFGEGPTNGVHGKSAAGRAIYGENTAGGDGVGGFSNTGTGTAGVSQSGIGVYGRSNSGRAGLFQGDVEVRGTIFCRDVVLQNGDCAERFQTGTETIEPGVVIVIGDDGNVCPSTSEYDPRVAGVIAGAGTLRPAVTLSGLDTDSDTAVVSLFGKVFCKVDAGFSPIAVGDLLTTSPTAGHAMVATDRERAFGSIVGKALERQERGTGLIAILLTLQ